MYSARFEMYNVKHVIFDPANMLAPFPVLVSSLFLYGTFTDLRTAPSPE